MNDQLERLARVELLAGWDQDDEPGLEESEVLRWDLYRQIAKTDERSDMAIRRVFEIASQEGEGPVVGVADQRLAQLEILEDAESYATLAGIPTSDIVHGQAWWAPNWAWWNTLRSLRQTEPDLDPIKYWDRVSHILLSAGGRSLASFYDLSSRGAMESLRRKRVRITLSAQEQASLMLVATTLQKRAELFASPPDHLGYRLHRNETSLADEVDATLSEIREMLEPSGAVSSLRRRNLRRTRSDTNSDRGEAAAGQH